MTTIERIQLYTVIGLCALDSVMWALVARNPFMAALWPLVGIVGIAFNRWSDSTPMPRGGTRRRRMP